MMLKKRFGIIAAALVVLVLTQGSALAYSLPTGMASPPVSKFSAPAYTRILKRGCRGADVKTLQNKLIELSFYSGAVDGIFGRGTESAVKSFQNAHDLKADGVVGRSTHNALYASAPSGGTDAGTPEPTPTPTSTPTPTYKLGKLDNQVMLKRGSRGSNVKDLQTVLKIKGFYSGAITSNFQNETKNAVMKFQRSVGLKSDALAGNYTLSALYTLIYPPDLNTILPWPEQLATGIALPVEKLTWTVASKSVFLRNMSAVIVDARTGYTFNVKRTGGTHHADVETLTPLDTATFYKSVGSFSWARRPIWVIVGGHRLAASMNCMPHGYDTIAGNDFKGQFCIHFVGSRTHGTNKTDPDHQACITEAYQKGLGITALPTPSPSPSPLESPSLPPTTDQVSES